MERKGYFKELIYTRCGPAYSIRGDELPSNNGYAIFNSSTGLWAQIGNMDLQFAERVIVRQFQWSYGCPVKRSWSYLLMPHGEEGVFADLYAYTDEDGANNSANSNMRGSHLAQMLSGIPSMYPYELIDSPYFSMRQKASTDIFYLDRCAPRLPEIAQENIPAGPLTRRKIQEFIRGREILVQLSAAWLIEQMDMPAAVRRPVIILDDGDNIPLWIAAITSCFPVAMARQIPFYTCREGLERLNASAFYRINKTDGEFVAQTNLQDPNQEARPLAMLIGCAKENTEAARQVSMMPQDASCVLLNGITKSVNFKPDEKSMKTGFIRSIAANPNFHASVMQMMDEMNNLKFSSSIFPIYDAIAELTEKAHPMLTELTDGLKTLRPYATVGQSCIRSVMNSLIEQGDYLEIYINQDAAQGFQTLREMAVYTQGRAEYGASMESLMIECLRKAVRGEISGLNLLWKEVQSDKKITLAAVNTLIGEERFSGLQMEHVYQMSEEDCGTLLEMQTYYVQANANVTWASVMSAPGPAFAAVIRRTLASPTLRRTLLGKLKDEMPAIGNYVIGGASLTGDTPENRRAWWETLLGDGISLDMLAQVIMNSSFFSAQDMEQMLIVAVRRQGYTQAIQQIYEFALSKVRDCGLAFFMEALQYALKRENNLRSDTLERLWKTAVQDIKSEDMVRRMIWAADSEITMKKENRNDVLAQFVCSHAQDNENYLAHTYFFLDGMTAQTSSGGLFRQQKEDILKQWKRVNPQFVSLPINQDLAHTLMGDALMKKLVENSDQLASVLLLVGGFLFTDRKYFDSWVNSYTDLLISENLSQKDTSFGTICGLKALIMNPNRMMKNEIRNVCSSIESQIGQDVLMQNMDALINCCVCVLSEEKKTAGYAERWLRNCEDEYGSEAAQILDRMLDKAIATYQKNNKGSGGLFGRFFGR